MATNTDILNSRRDATGEAWAFARHAHERWVNDGCTLPGDRRWTLATVVASSDMRVTP
ncbi:MAG: hypothetical protein QOK18_848 [Mycobacterium sp.]|nr:hypothetical protein [Mycobacterium sp.]